MNQKTHDSLKGLGRSLAIALVCASMTGCGLLDKLGTKSISSGLLKATNFSQSGTVFKEVPYGQAVGTVVTPNFQVASSQSLDVMSVPNGQTSNTDRVVSSGTLANVPDVPVASNVNGSTVFAYTKLFVATCADKCRYDLSNVGAANRLCTFDTGVAPNAGANVAAWDQSIKDMAGLFWGRKDLTATEMAALTTLRDEVAAASLAKTPGNNSNANNSAFYAVCATMQLAPASLTQ